MSPHCHQHLSLASWIWPKGSRLPTPNSPYPAVGRILHIFRSAIMNWQVIEKEWDRSRCLLRSDMPTLVVQLKVFIRIITTLIFNRILEEANFKNGFYYRKSDLELGEDPPCPKSSMKKRTHTQLELSSVSHCLKEGKHQLMHPSDSRTVMRKLTWTWIEWNYKKAIFEPIDKI